ncbi:cytochrome P450 [uncultured Thiodictyon sp.]|uniref:cytochrome P450 n=1 Tax=uncultured Thiodictyon sp. TaxID=1846217 RepID=UPI0025DD4BB8|nr:cytochrome P450 [uncultured Thiodictyon sp.]
MIKPGNTRRGAKSKRLNRLMTIPVSHISELVRWMLDYGGVPYREEGNVPMLHLPSFWLAGADTQAMPVLVTSEAALCTLRESLEYIDARLPAELRLYPRDPDGLAETERLLVVLVDELGLATRNYGYAMLLPHKQTVLTFWQRGVPGWQRWLAAVAYPLIADTLVKVLPADPGTIEPSKQKIEAVFAELDALLADGRAYLLGSRPTIADYCLAALAAPVLLPEQFGGVQPSKDELPAAYQAFVDQLRATPTGALALTMYRQHRPAPQPVLDHHPTSTTPENFFSYYMARGVATLTGPSVQRVFFNVLRKYKPVLFLAKRVLVTRDRDVRETLARDTEFTIAEINAPNMQRLNGAFFLGMDRSETYTKEQGAVRRVIQSGEDQLIRRIVRKHCDDMIRAARPVGRIDMVSQLTRPVARRVVRDYLGVPGPDEITVMRWLRSLFHDLFLNLSNDRGIQMTAEQSFREMGPYLLNLIAERRAQLQQGEQFDDFLSRFIKMGMDGEHDLDDDGIRRNISGLLVGALDTNSMATTLIVEQLLNKPDVLQRARLAVDNEEQLLHLCFDVFRFNTMAAAMRRHCKNGADIAGVTIPQGTEVFAFTSSAMFDETAWPEPYTVRDDRSLDRYLHFGDGMHRCFGEYVNRIQIPTLVGSLLRLKNLRTCSGILYDGPFPDQFVLSFDR